MTAHELDNLVFGAFFITAELASRFLDDYLTGEAYFKVNYPGHNLVRAKCQLHLAKDIMVNFGKLCKSVADIMKG